MAFQKVDLSQHPDPGVNFSKIEIYMLLNFLLQVDP